MKRRFSRNVASQTMAGTIMRGFDKICTICGGPVANVAKVLTCQKCRHEQHKRRIAASADKASNLTLEQKQS